MITALIVDDEKRSRETVLKMVQKYCKSIQVIGQAASVEEAHEFINSTKPDLVFLDVEMPRGSGFDLLKRFPEVDFEVIFTTAYDEYAINAIKFCAIDYLLKPIDIDELIQAVGKVEVLMKSRATTTDRFQHLLDNLAQKNQKPEKVGIPTQEGLEFVMINSVIRCEAEGSYTKLFLQGGRVILATGTIKEFEELLHGNHFIRVHHSHLINANWIHKYVKGEGGMVVMDDGAEVPISRRKKEAFLKQLQTL
ncbi:MAG: LytR/AlgR family response regulator transcription factor [Flammeovirgaceae bacterium]